MADKKIVFTSQRLAIKWFNNNCGMCLGTETCPAYAGVTDALVSLSMTETNIEYIGAVAEAEEWASLNDICENKT